MERMEVSGQTFVLDVSRSDNGELKGTILWVQKNKKIPFQSAIEMNRTIELIMGSNEVDKKALDITSFQPHFII